MKDKTFAVCILVWPWPWRYVPGSRSWYDCVKYYQDPTWQWGVMAQIRFWYVCTLTLTSEIWPMVKVMTLLGHVQQIEQFGEITEFWPGHGFWICTCMHCDLDIRDMTLGQGYDTPLGNGQQLCEILSVRSYDPDTVFGMCALWPGQGHSTPLGHGQQF